MTNLLNESSVTGLSSLGSSRIEAINTSRALFNTSELGNKNLYGESDLIVRLNSEFTLKDISNDLLPAEMKNMSIEEKEEFVKLKSNERKKLMNDLKELANKREIFIENELKNKENEVESFSQKVFKLMQIQAGNKGIVIEGDVKH